MEIIKFFKKFTLTVFTTTHSNHIVKIEINGNSNNYRLLIKIIFAMFVFWTSTNHVCLLKLLAGILLQQDINVDIEVKLFSNYGNEKIRVKEGNYSHLSGG